MNPVTAKAAPLPLAQAAAQVGTRVPSPIAKPAVALDVYEARKPAAAPLGPIPSPAAKVWDGIKRGLFVGTLAAPVAGVAIFGAVLCMFGMSCLPAAAIGAGVWLAATAAIGGLWGSKQ